MRFTHSRTSRDKSRDRFTNAKHALHFTFLLFHVFFPDVFLDFFQRPYQCSGHGV